jgi:hypothetical protein
VEELELILDQSGQTRNHDKRSRGVFSLGAY